MNRSSRSSRRPGLSSGFRLGGAVLALCLLSLPAGIARAQQETPPGPPPVTARDGIATVLTENLVETVPGSRPLVRVAFPDAPGRPVLAEDSQAGPAAALLRRLYAAGRAAGHHGDLYDNRDRGHSALPRDAFPQLTRIAYGPRLRAASLDYGVAMDLLFDAPVIGNSSTALTGGPLWRSQPRLMLTAAEGPHRLWQGYGAGQIHIYPEHRDHDPEYGDLLPANTPYYLISQGSSGSDQAHLQALAMILAAFRPDTKAVLRETGLLAPTVQMVYRRSRRDVLSRADYLGGAAHPSVFDADGIALARMVTLANAIAPQDVPPVVRLEMVQETGLRAGADLAEGLPEGLTERLFDTPSAIARVWRSRDGRREMIVSAAATRDPNGRDLTFDWVLLRGDPDRVRITPLDDGRRARIVVDWQDPRPVPGQPEITSPRIDIGVFAHNGVHDSAPAFVSVLLPRHERRVYEAGPDGAMRIAWIDRAAGPGVYADPAVFPAMAWRDVYAYDAAGRLTGWTRHDGGAATRHDAPGAPVEPDTAKIPAGPPPEKAP